MITEAQEAAVSDARARSRQDKKNPFLIHVDDARLVPNVPRLRTHPKYRVFTGPVKATKEERKAWLASMGGGRRVILDSSNDLPPFDIGKATLDELVAFAGSEYGTIISPDKRMTAQRQLDAARAEVRKLAELHGSIGKTPAEDLT